MKVLQINVTANWGSTGHIAEQINLQAQQRGWDTYIAYGRHATPSKSKLIKCGSQLQVYEHYAEYCLLDNDGLASRLATRKLIREISELKPDIIHLHNIHDHWLNYKILFDYLNTLGIPIVWTIHDCWAFTGDCCHFTAFGCERWKTGCSQSCPYRKSRFCGNFSNRTEEHYKLKKRLFLSTRNLSLVPVSKWLEGVVRDSFLKEKNIQTIYNGVDTEVFHPLKDTEAVLKKYGLENTRYVMGVATAWSERKGFPDYCKLAALIEDDIKIVLVGLNSKKIKEAEKYGIIGIARTENVLELAALYNGASIILNLSYEETFGLTTVEGFACGTPSIVYNSTASPELVSPDTGIIVNPGDVEGIAAAVRRIMENPAHFTLENCRRRAVENFNKDQQFAKYISLYKSLLQTINSNELM